MFLSSHSVVQLWAKHIINDFSNSIEHSAVDPIISILQTRKVRLRLSKLQQSFSNLNRNHLGIIMSAGLGKGAWDSALLTSCQVMLMLLVCGQHSV